MNLQDRWLYFVNTGCCNLRSLFICLRTTGHWIQKRLFWSPFYIVTRGAEYIQCFALKQMLFATTKHTFLQAVIISLFSLWINYLLHVIYMQFEKSIFIPSASILAKIQCAVVTMKSENTIVRIYYKWVFFWIIKSFWWTQNWPLWRMCECSGNPRKDR